MLSSSLFKPVLRKPLGRAHRTRSHDSLPEQVGQTPQRQRLRSVVDCAAYVDGQRVETRNVTEAVRAVRDQGFDEAGSRFVWLGLHEPAADDLESLAEIFGLHPLAVEDAVHAHQRPKLERYDGVTFMVLKTCRYVEHEHVTPTNEIVDTGEIMIFLGNDFVLTVRHGEHGALKPVRRRLENSPELLALGPAAVLHSVADQVVDDYLKVADGLQADLDEVETRVFSPEGANDVERIYHLKREIIELKRAVAPLAQPLRQLIARHFVPAQIREYFRDVEDHLTRVREHVASYDELLTSILQAHLAQIAVGDNRDMRKISAWAAIMAVPTAVCAVYGMNFRYMPELHWRFGYPLVMALIVVVCAFLYRGFRRNGWL